MNTAKHTPGPWKFAKSEWRNQLSVMLSSAYGTNIARVFMNHVKREESEATASLIAAAPELLEAAKCAFEDLDNRYDGAPDSRTLWIGESLEKLRAAIAKAEGGAR